MEEEIIKLIKSITGSEKYIGDDCAVLSLSGDFLFSLDSLVEDVHFTQELFDAYHLGWKSAAVNISDIAAMAAEPKFLLVGLSLPQKIAQSKKWIEDFYRGINDASQNSISIPQVIGGDLTCAEKITVAITVIGKAGEHGVFKRSGAKPGYKVCVTGKFGNSKSYLDGDRDEAANTEYFYKPQARVAEAMSIWQTCQDGALIDSSDGLAQSLIEISKQSQVKISFDSGLIPRDKHVTLEQALYGGEDYELVGAFPEIPEGFKQIGAIEDNLPEGYSVYDSQTKSSLDPNSISFNHFR